MFCFVTLLLCVGYSLWIMYKAKKYWLGLMVMILTAYPVIAFFVP